MSFRTRSSIPALIVALALGGVACAPQDETTASPGTTTASPSAASCSKDQLAVVNAGKFTVGTDKPAYEPWFADDTPSNGKGFESAVAYAVAAKLGFTKTEVSWIVVPFTNAYSPGNKKFDVDVNQVSITEARRKAVDFSSGYYDVAQAVISTAGSKIVGAKSLADLKDAKLGAQVGTTSYTAIIDQIKPTKQAAVYDTNDLAVQALKNGQVDGIVVDLPTAFIIVATELEEDGAIVGQLPAASGTPDQFGMVLAKGSALTPCVSRAVDALKSDGTLEKLQAQWLDNASGAPELS